MVASAVIGGATLIGAGIASSGNRRAVQAQTQAAQESNATQLQIYQDQQRRLEPFRQFSMTAMGPLAELLGLESGQTAPQTGPRMPGGMSMPGTPGMQNFGGFGPALPDAPDSGMTLNPLINGYGDFDFRDIGRNPMTPGTDGGPPPYTTVPRETGITTPPPGQTGPAPPPGATPPPDAPPGAPAPGGNRQLEALRQSPGYQFRLQEGISSRDASAASRGLLLSGAQQRAIERFGQDYGSNEYGNRIAQLSAVLSGGQYANNALSQAGQNYAGAIGQSNAAAANARASGYQNNANIWNQAIGTGVGLWGASTDWNFGRSPPPPPPPAAWNPARFFDPRQG